MTLRDDDRCRSEGGRSLHKDVDRRAKLGANPQDRMDDVVHEPVEWLGVQWLGLAVHSWTGLRSEQLIESRRPLTLTQSSGGGAVIHHVSHSARVHVWVERIHRLDD